MTDLKLENSNDAVTIKNLLIKKWESLETNTDVFRYKLNVRKQAVLEGKFNFFIQLNAERVALRRPPQKITSLIPEFNADAFNFNKINEAEILFHVFYENNIKTTFLVNNSPLTKYHSLICPKLTENCAQILTKDSIAFAITFLFHLNDCNFRIGYNSPGALASVNHLHMHLIYLTEKLYIENVKIFHLTKNIYKIDNKNPVNGFCFPLININQTNEICNDVIRLIDFFCKENIPHNIFITFGTKKSLFNQICDDKNDDEGDGCGGVGGCGGELMQQQCEMTPLHEEKQHRQEPTTLLSTSPPLLPLNNQIIKIFVFPRENNCLVKEFSTFNVAFCELSGYVPVGNENIYDQLSETVILEKFTADIGDPMKVLDLERKVYNLFNDVVASL